MKSCTAAGSLAVQSLGSNLMNSWLVCIEYRLNGQCMASVHVNSAGVCSLSFVVEDPQVTACPGRQPYVADVGCV